MNIKVDFTVPEKLINFIERGDYKKRSEFDRLLDELHVTTSFQKMLQFYEGIFDHLTYREILFSALNGLAYQTNDDMLQMLYDNLVRINDDLERLKNKLRSIQNYDFSSIVFELQPTLPENTELEIELYFVFDGINGGSIVDNHTMLINTMLWPSNKDHEKIIKDVLLHEYHHIGIKFWLDKHGHTDERKYENKEEFFTYLTASIVGEGAATYFFTSSNNLYPLLLESHGQDLANNFKESINLREANIKQLLMTLNNDLTDILDHDRSVDAMKDLSNKYNFDPSLKEPLDKAIGYYLCKSVDEVLGRRQLIECFKEPNLIYGLYNKTIKSNGEFRFHQNLKIE